jgi:hypothetical protein
VSAHKISIGTQIDTDNFEDGWHSFNNVANRLWFDLPTGAGFTFKIG